MTTTRWILRLLPIAIAILCLTTFLVLLPAVHLDVDRPAARLVRSALEQGSTHFAIADFDGDQRPDLAMIRVSRDGVPDTEYSLQLKFSSGARAPIGLIGPAGGLEVSPQDVNGDQIADLVITSVVDSNFVAILLNDGKGNFTKVDRAEYPGVGRPASSHLLAPLDSGSHHLAVGQCQNLYGDEIRSAKWEGVPQTSSPLSSDCPESASDSLQLLPAGRAPPLV
jgi:hypothetical protein